MLGEIEAEVLQMAKWQKVSDGLQHGGYVAWETAVSQAQGDGGRDHVPVFVTLQPVPGIAETLLEAIDATRALPDLRLSQHERDLLMTERVLAAKAGGWPHEVRVVVFWPRRKLDAMPAFWDVRQVGPGLAIPPTESTVEGCDLCATEGDLKGSVPVIAVIDDGIGFLNARFRKDRHKTRIRALWLQAPEQGMAAGDVVCGTVLESHEIDGWLRKGHEEASVYRNQNRLLQPITDVALTNQRAAHGTHVLDLAAGADPWSGEDKIGATPILAVQLPPASVRETAGRRMETYLVQGLRWVLAKALHGAKHTKVPPVVVNISLGSLAGPGDEHAFLADWFDYELARHSRMAPGAEVRLVIAYGNARLARLVARDEIRPLKPMKLIWRVQPDDHSSSYLELRVDEKKTAGLRLRLAPPEGSGLPVLEVPWPEAGKGWKLSGPVAAVASVAEEGGQSLVHLALGPTAGTTGALPPAPSGAWQVEVHTTVIEPVRVTARVQRDDTPPGYRTLGRQSWLDNPQGWDWDDELRGYLAPRSALDAPGCPVTREGSCVAYAGATDPRILFVGAALPVLGAPGKLRPTLYSSEGVRYLARPGESRGPTLVAQADDGVILDGRRAAGVLSGSVVRMSGTSMAAPLVARALARYFLTVPKAQRSPEAERTFLTGSADWVDPDSRMGHGALIA
jgi:hypothetical protein